MAPFRDEVLLPLVSADGSILHATPNHQGDNAVDVTEGGRRRSTLATTAESGVGRKGGNGIHIYIYTRHTYCGNRPRTLPSCDPGRESPVWLSKEAREGGGGALISFFGGGALKASRVDMRYATLYSRSGFIMKRSKLNNEETIAPIPQTCTKRAGSFGSPISAPFSTSFLHHYAGLNFGKDNMLESTRPALTLFRYFFQRRNIS